jgi:hypothetical protein
MEYCCLCKDQLENPTDFIKSSKKVKVERGGDFYCQACIDVLDLINSDESKCDTLKKEVPDNFKITPKYTCNKCGIKYEGTKCVCGNINPLFRPKKGKKRRKK